MTSKDVRRKRQPYNLLDYIDENPFFFPKITVDSYDSLSTVLFYSRKALSNVNSIK